MVILVCVASCGILCRWTTVCVDGRFGGVLRRCKVVWMEALVDGGLCCGMMDNR